LFFFSSSYQYFYTFIYLYAEGNYSKGNPLQACFNLNVLILHILPIINVINVTCTKNNLSELINKYLAIHSMTFLNINAI